MFDPNKVTEQVLHRWSGVFRGQLEPVFQNMKLDPLPDLEENDPLLEDLPKSHPTKHENIVCRPFTENSLKTILNSLKDGKSCGFDNIPNEILKYGGDLLLKYLSALYNKILEEGVVPEILNTVKCVLIHKSGDSLDMLNYR